MGTGGVHRRCDTHVRVLHQADAGGAGRIRGNGRRGGVDDRDPAATRRCDGRVAGVVGGQAAAAVPQRLESPSSGKTRHGHAAVGVVQGERPGLEGFTAQQACRLTGCTAHQLRYWDRVKLIQPSLQHTGGRPGRRRLYTFRDLVALRVVRSLLDNGMSVQRVRRAWDYLRRTGDMDTHLAEVKLVTDGQTIFRVASNEAELLDAL
ncbi:MAG TPA: hypothetical protein DCY40_07515, partial [Actinobacteria bacterium]|nr:hypothetical protein [Actinomycetota bacterium]